MDKLTHMTIYLEQKLKDIIFKKAKENNRTASQQVIYILKGGLKKW